MAWDSLIERHYSPTLRPLETKEKLINNRIIDKFPEGKIKVAT